MFRLQTLYSCPGQYLVEVAVKVAMGSRRRPVEFLRDLLTTMMAIRQREFAKMWFIVGLHCHHPPAHDQEPNDSENDVHVKARKIAVDVNEVIMKDLVTKVILIKA